MLQLLPLEVESKIQAVKFARYLQDHGDETEGAVEDVQRPYQEKKAGCWSRIVMMCVNGDKLSNDIEQDGVHAIYEIGDFSIAELDLAIDAVRFDAAEGPRKSLTSTKSQWILQLCLNGVLVVLGTR